MFRRFRDLGAVFRSGAPGGDFMRKLIVWGIIGFALYAGYRQLPGWLDQKQLEGAVANVLEHGTHTMTDEAIRTRTLHAARSEAIPLDASDVHIRRESRNGERIIHVEFEVADGRRIQASHSYAVDEAAEARLAAQLDESRRAAAEQNRRSQAAMKEYRRRVKAECRKGGPDVVTTTVMVTGANGNYHLVDCDDARRWPDP